MKQHVMAVIFISSILFSALAGASLIHLAAANPAVLSVDV
jgi:hypothetical protein